MRTALAVVQSYRAAMDSGEAFAAQERWQQARTQFEAAARIRPGDGQALLRAAYCMRRLNPPTAGVRIVNNRVDAVTGLPAEVEIPELRLSMLAVAGGVLDIGSNAFVDSRPVHTVRVPPFYLGKYEVTQEQWQRIMGSNPSVHRAASAEALQMPGENVSWKDCEEFVDRLNRQIAGGGFRLPTEAEWEFAAHPGGATSWFLGNSQVRENPAPDFTDFAPHRVGLKAPNALGFHDMLGNVWEWCSTLFRPYPYEPEDGREDPHAPGLRVLRGGSYADSEDLMSPSFRHADRPERRLRWNGFRLARQVNP